ncbi:MAG: hypothetical protein ACT4P4_27665, partial [Betaproteobacteria bacterium]
MTRLLIIAAVFALAGCASAPRPAAFGAPVALSADCGEVAGRYLEAPSHATGEGQESLSTLLGRVLDNPAKVSGVASFVLSFPQNRVLRVAFLDLKGAEAGVVDLRESHAEYRCANGVLEISTGSTRLFTSGSETLTFTRTSGNYLML